MTFHIYKEDLVTPVDTTIDMRAHIDTGGPHLFSCGLRTVVADAASIATVIMNIQYLFPNGTLRVAGPDPINLSTDLDALGGIWYMPQELIMDKFLPLGDGSPTAPYGLLKLDFNVVGDPKTAKYAYEAVFVTFDGNPSVVYHPAL